MMDTTFVPAEIDATRFEAVEPLYRALLERPISSAAELERWLIDRGELDAACSEARANLYIAMTCFTEDAARQQAFARYVEEVPPRLKPLDFALDRRYVELASRFALSPERYRVLDRDIRCEVELFREENVPLETELELLVQKFEQVAGAQTVHFEGREQTLPQMARYQEMTDRAVREAAWHAVAERRLRDAPAIDEIYDAMIALRDRIARNAGFDSFIPFAFKRKHRFDYTPRHCFEFHEAVERHVAPLMRGLNRERRSALGVGALRPWDLVVDPKGRPPLRPFEGGRELVAKATATFSRLDPRLGAMLGSLGDGSEARGAEGGACLDLDTRKGKAPGGYQYMRDRSRRSFIFMNAAGLSRDVETMLHEAGHCFHSMLCVEEPLLAYRSAPIEFCEVASMSMELLTMPHWGDAGGFYPTSEEHARAVRKHLEGVISILPWIATIDAFQHWVYANPGHKREERVACWLELDRRFGPECDWSGLEPALQRQWQRQSHLFSHAFYYIEYGIAQLGALQLWLVSKERGSVEAVEAYLRAMRLGGSRPLPELFDAAGLRFDFGPATVGRISERLAREIEALPA